MMIQLNSVSYKTSLKHSFAKKMSNFLVLQCFTAVKFCLTAQQRSKGVGEGLLVLVEILKDFLTTTHQR